MGVLSRLDAVSDRNQRGGRIRTLLRLQDHLPLNPLGLAAPHPDLSFNTVVSFATNTSWQNYAGESTLSHWSQMAVITVLSFTSGATGLALAIAFIRGLARHSARTLGNFWVDFTRAIVYILPPVCVVVTVILVSQGAIQNLNALTVTRTIAGVTQSIAQGPVASQEAIKVISGDGGGFFNANSAHPYGAGAWSAKWSRRSGTRPCSWWPGTAIAPGSGHTASDAPPSSSSTMRRAPCC